MINRKLKINFLDTDSKKSSTTISYVNTSSTTTSDNLRNFAVAFINLTDNTYLSSTKIDEEILD